MAAMTILKVSGVLAMGSLAGIEPIKNAIIAAGVAVLEVLEQLSKAYMEDGYLSDDEINAAFAAQAGAKQSVEEEELG